MKFKLSIGLMALTIIMGGNAIAQTAGSIDTTFNPGSGIVGGFYFGAVQPDNKILLAGSIRTYNGNENIINM